MIITRALHLYDITTNTQTNNKNEYIKLLCVYIYMPIYWLVIVPGLINGNTFVFIQTNGHPLRYHVSESIKVIFDSVSK